MTPSQVKTELARILSALAGFDAKKRKIPVIDQNNKVVGSDTDERLSKTCESDLSQSFIRLRFRNSPQPSCRVVSRCLIKEMPEGAALAEKGYNPEASVQVIETGYEIMFTVTAVRCNSMDILHQVRQEFNNRPFGHELHPQIKNIPVVGDITDVSAFSASDDFQDRAETTITVEYCDRSISFPNCKPICFGEIITAKNGQSIQDAIAKRIAS